MQLLVSLRLLLSSSFAVTETYISQHTRARIYKIARLGQWDKLQCQPVREEEEDNDRFYEVNPLLDGQPGGKINTEPSSLGKKNFNFRILIGL